MYLAACEIDAGTERRLCQGYLIIWLAPCKAAIADPMPAQLGTGDSGYASCQLPEPGRLTGVMLGTPARVLLRQRSCSGHSGAIEIPCTCSVH